MKRLSTLFRTGISSLQVSKWPERRVAICLLLLLLASLFIKLTVLWLDHGLGRDACWYLHMAKIWRETGSYEALQSLGDADRIPPLLPFLIKSMMSAGIPAETAGFAINVILGSLTTLVGFGLALETTENKTIALLTAILIAVHPRINDLSTEVQRDVPYLFFSGCALWLILVGLRRKKSVLWCAAGIALAFSLLLRYEAAELLLLIPAAAFVSALFRRLSWKQALSYAAAFIACTGISFYSLLLLMGTPEFVSSYFNYVAIESICAKQQLFGTSESRGK